METSGLKQQVRRAARGDTVAAGELFDTYYGRVFRYAYGKLGNQADAEDIASETFARVLGGLDRFKWRGAGFEAWIFRIAGNLVVDRTRVAGREVVAEQTGDEATPGAESPEEDLVRKELAADLQTMLEGLAPDQREVLLLRFAAGLDTNEVAGVMDKNANAVRQLQFRALKSIREKMGQGVNR